MSLYYLSFCDPDRPEGQQWIGGCLVDADDHGDAVFEARERGCNPGGEVQIVGPLPIETRVRDGCMNRLVSDRVELETLIVDDAAREEVDRG